MNDIKISVVVCTYNGSDIISGCLESLENQTLNKRFYEIIVVDNNSIDSTIDIVRDYASRHTNLRLLIENRQGLSHARNRGYVEAKGTYVAYIDDDGRARENWLENILKAFETMTPQPCVVGGPIYPFYLTQKPHWFLDKYEIRLISKKSGFIKFKHGIPNFSGSNMAFKKDVLDAYGGFSPEFGVVGTVYRAGEEVELFTRIYKDVKYFWYDIDSIVKHLVPEEKMSLQYIQNRYFWAGHAYQRLSFRESSPFPFLVLAIKWILRIVYNLILLLVSVNWGEKGWENKYICHATPLSGSMGALIALFETKFHVKIVV